MEARDFDGFILENMPHFIAVNYQRLLAAQTPQDQISYALTIFNLGLRALTINLVSQYLLRDRERVSDLQLNSLLHDEFPYVDDASWPQIFFAVLRAYKMERHLLFM